MRVEDIEQMLLRLVKEPNYKPVKPRVLAKRLEVPEDDRRLLKRAIKGLVKRGQLTFGANHLVGPAAVPTAAPRRRLSRDRRVPPRRGRLRIRPPRRQRRAPTAPKTSTSPPATRWRRRHRRHRAGAA